MLYQPIPKRYSKGHNAIHETAGLPGYPASDFFADAGSPVIAPEDGVIRRFSGHDPAQGPISGPHGPLGWTIYLTGDSRTDYFITHLATRTCTVGQKVKCGDLIATVADYLKYGTPSHTHVGVHGGVVSIEILMNAPLYMPLTTADKFQWAAWRLGEGTYKKWGKANPLHRPKSLPQVVPVEWWGWLKAFLAKRKS